VRKKKEENDEVKEKKRGQRGGGVEGLYIFRGLHKIFTV
jgi:hypothetical protein